MTEESMENSSVNIGEKTLFDYSIGIEHSFANFMY